MKTKAAKVLALTLALVLALPAPAMGRAPERLQGSDGPPTFTITDVIEAVDLQDAVRTADGRVRVIVELTDPAVAAYTGGVPGLRPTSTLVTGARKLDLNSPDSQAYMNYLRAKQDAVANTLAKVAPTASLDYRYQAAFNGLSMAIAEDDVIRLLKIPDVKRVYPDRVNYVEMDASLPLINAPALWGDLGGQANAGSGIFVAVVDSGIRPENPMFSGAGYSMPGGFPKGYCVTNPGDPDFQSSEVITSPLDIDGHGSHTAGTSAGNPVTVTAASGLVPVDTAISGVAPHAYVMAYKALFESPDGTTASGTNAMLLAALNDAFIDGADVINNSWGGGPGDPNASPFFTVINNITAGGTLVVFSAGNSGPGGATIGCPGCVESALTVAASTTNRIFAKTLDVTGPGTVPPSLMGLAALPGTGPTITTTITGGITYAGSVDAANVQGCNAFPAGAFAGKLALIQRGTCSFAQKVDNAAAAGAIAAVIYNNVGGPPIVMGSLESTTIPSVMLDKSGGEAVRDWAVANSSATARINLAVSRVVNDSWQDIVAGFSSVGPNGDPDVLKPDITAPGVNILSAFSPVLSGGDNFAFLQGTSMAAPHVTGSAALMFDLHPTWTPAQVKTALTSTSAQSLLKPDGATPADPFSMGAGRVDLGAARQAGLTFDKPSFADSVCFITCSWTRTLTNVTNKSATWSARVDTSDPDLSLSVAPDFTFLAPGQSISFTVTANVVDLAPDNWYFGSVVWEEDSQEAPDAHLPVAVFATSSTDAATVTKTADRASVQPNGTVSYTINIANNNPVTTTYLITDVIPDNATYLGGTATGGLVYDAGTDALTGAVTLGGLNIDVAVDSSPAGYVSPLGLTGVLSLTANCTTCDESGFNISGFDFYYLGTHYTSVGIISNGYIVPGTITGADIEAVNQQLPDATVPNNVIAAFWTDLDLDGTNASDTGGGSWPEFRGDVFRRGLGQRRALRIGGRHQSGAELYVPDLDRGRHRPHLVRLRANQRRPTHRPGWRPDGGGGECFRNGRTFVLLSALCRWQRCRHCAGREHGPDPECGRSYGDGWLCGAGRCLAWRQDRQRR
jgi:uncharacterized repeat protein (TIGR01451 family)